MDDKELDSTFETASKNCPWRMYGFATCGVTIRGLRGDCLERNCAVVYWINVIQEKYELRITDSFETN